jgi:azurin
MRATLGAGIAPARSRSIPVLEVSPQAKVEHWLTDESAPAEPRGPAAKAVLQPVNKTYTTFIKSDVAQTALLGVRHGFMDVMVNGVQIFSVDHQYSLEHQLVLDLQPGINSVEIAYRRLRGAAPAVSIYNSLGQPLSAAIVPSAAEELNQFAAEWSKLHAADQGALRVQAVPHQMKFAPAELRVTAGEPVRIVFENPDLMPHNFVVVAPGTLEAIGLLADAMASATNGMAKNYVPDSKSVLHATPLINHKGRFELLFTAPALPGDYPFVCTYPGHWRMMRGILVVQAARAANTRD